MPPETRDHAPESRADADHPLGEALAKISDFKRRGSTRLLRKSGTPESAEKPAPAAAAADPAPRPRSLSRPVEEGEPPMRRTVALGTSPWRLAFEAAACLLIAFLCGNGLAILWQIFTWSE
jgi:hypothetical protein